MTGPGSTDRMRIIGDRDDDSAGGTAYVWQAPRSGTAAPASVPVGSGGPAADLADLLAAIAGRTTLLVPPAGVA